MRASRLAITALAALGALGALLAAALGPGAAPLVEALGDERKIWRLGILELEGVTGPHLGALSASRARLRDEDGVWAEARDVVVRWRPAAFLGGVADLDQVAAAEVEIYRRPKLGPPPPRGGSVDVLLDVLTVERLILAEAVGGEASVFSLAGGLALRDRAVTQASLEATRIDDGADALTLSYRGAPLRIEARLLGPEGGFFAGLAGAPVVADARAADGRGRLTAEIGEADALDATLQWTAGRWRGAVDLDLAAAPALRDLAARFGGRYAVAAEGGRPLKGEAGFTASITGAEANLAVAGTLAPGLKFEGPLDIEGVVPAAWASLAGGQIGFDGAVRLNEDGASRYEGAVRADGLALPGFTFSSAGAARVAMSRRAIDVRLDLSDADIRGSEALRRLMQGADFSARARWDRQTSTLDLTDFAAASPAARASGGGTFSDGSLALSGAWRVLKLEAVTPELRGEAQGRWRAARASAKAAYRISAKGEATRLDSPVSPLAELLGTRGALSADLAIAGPLIQIERATFEGAKLRAGAAGPVRDGRADLRLEASARGPLLISGATISGAADATGRIAGPLDALGISAEARLGAVAFAGVAATDATATATLSPQPGGGYDGRLGLRASVSGQPAEASARAVFGDDVIRFEDAVVTYAALEGRGRAQVGPEGPSGQFTLNGRLDGLAPRTFGAITGSASFASVRGGPRVEAAVQLTNARFGPGLRVASGRMTAAGLMRDLAVEAQATGRTRTGADFVLSASGRADLQDGVAARVTLAGAVAGAQIATIEPIDARLEGGAVSATGGLRVDGGEARFVATRSERAVDARATFNALPIGPFAALAGERGQGTLTGEASLQGSGPRLSGEADLTLVGGQLARRGGAPIDARLQLALTDQRLTGQVAASAADGLKLSIEGAIPVTASAAPLRIARSQTAAANAAWTVSGPIGGLWAAFGPLDQSLSGVVNGAGAARIAPGGGLSGSGEIQLSDGRFEDKVTGLRLQAVSAEAAFSPEGVSLEALSARDGRGGSITGAGLYRRGAGGQVRLELSSLALLNRPDARARAGGALTLDWNGDEARLSGDLRLSEAEVSPPETATSIPTIDVIEINGPVEDAPDDQPAATTGLPPVRLDVRIRGPERVFTRGRGLNAEWALDLRLAGTLDAPQVLGEARMIRGYFDLAGRRFDIERGIVRFTGDPAQAQVELAAVRTEPDLTARILISGTPQDPKVDFSSTPALPPDEVLPQVLFGRSAQELSAFEAAQLAAGLATLAGQASFDIAGAARNAIDLDRLDVRQQDGGLLVTGGRYITRDVYLEVSRGPLGMATTSVEWQVRPRLFLISSFAGQGEQRLAVRWRRDF